MGLFADLLGAAAAAVRTVIDIAADVASTAVRVVRTEYTKLKEKYRNIDVEQRKKERFEQLKGVNDEIIDLERKHRRDGRLNEDDQERLESLNRLRRELRRRVEAAKEFEVAGDIVDNSDSYAAKVVDHDSPNELTRLGGQVVMGKQCAKCHRPMAIRWPTNIRDPAITDLFWGCTGFFFKDQNDRPACKHTQRFSDQDIRLFGRIERPGMELPAERLTKMVLTPPTSEHVKGRLRQAIGEVTENYLCPVHHERMVLKTKAQATDILDLYYLRCSRCDQMVKIKSATQLDAVLESYSGNGLFSA
jgi:hypothetical protein